LSAFKLVRRIALLGCLGTAFVLGCSEDPAPPPVDDQGPSVRVLFPPYIIGNEFTVSDSTHIYIAATDNDAIQSVSAWWSRPGESQRRLIASTAQEVPLSSVPDSISAYVSVPEGWSLYRIRWETLEISSGTRPQLFATADDPSGNSGASEVVTVFILNIGKDLGPPFAAFIVRPPEGDIDVTFVFDAIGPNPDDPLTHDAIDLPGNIDVRWDFNGDEVWDVDWDAGAKATDPQSYTFAAPGPYVARMQARNTYFEDPSPIATSFVTVNPRGGAPHWPASMDGQFVSIPPGNMYPRGAHDPEGADADEFPVHRVNLPFEVRMLSREVTNAEYVHYLQVDSVLVIRPPRTQPEAIFESNRIFRNASGDSAVLYFDLDESRIFYDLDSEEFRVQRGFENHPVQGVTWFGAAAFAERYGLRLPTEAEWEAAARGTQTTFRYPYGREITTGDSTGQRRINYAASGDPFEGDDGTTPARYYNGEPNPQGFTTIDSPSPLGCYDMSGNLAEWCADWYGPYSSEAVQTNPQGPRTGEFKVIRGGSYQSSAEGVRVSSREADHRPDVSYPSVGFRVCYTETN
jgi:formylglycine-generating enzyme required for sulfatase activity